MCARQKNVRSTVASSQSCGERVDGTGLDGRRRKPSILPRSEALRSYSDRKLVILLGAREGEQPVQKPPCYSAGERQSRVADRGKGGCPETSGP